MTIRWFLAVLLIAAYSSAVRAQASFEPEAAQSVPAGPGDASSSHDQPPAEADTVRLILYPQPAPSPALKHGLLPSVLERRPGNAAPHYLKATLRFQGTDSRRLSEQEEKVAQWAAMPLDQLPLEDMRATLANVAGYLDDIQLAARREFCDWELPIHERRFIELLLPEAQEARRAARYLSARARLEIAERKFDAAIGSLQTGFSLGQHVAEGPTLINNLVGISISTVMAEQALTLAQQHGAPNLYWALTALPTPLFDMRKAMETEAAMLYLSYPELRDVEKANGSGRSWQDLIQRMMQDLGAAPDQSSGTTGQLVMTALALKGYSPAKRALVEQGRPQEEVEAMPVAQVVLLYSLQQYNRTRDEMFKWSYVPYPQAQQGMQQAEESLKQMEGEIVPLASLLLPALRQVRTAAARMDRRIAAQRIIEAIRMYGASHGGKLPARLSDVVEVPIPADPVTGREFDYSLRGDVALLSAPPPAAVPTPSNALRYELRFAK